MAVCLIYLYYRKKQYKLHYFPSKENQEVVAIIEPLLWQYKPAIHVPMMIQLLLNSFEVIPHYAVRHLRTLQERSHRRA